MRVKVFPKEDETVKELSKNRVSQKVLKRTIGSIMRETERILEPFESTGRERVSGVPTVRRPFFLPKMESNARSDQIPLEVIQALKLNCVNPLSERFPTLPLNIEIEDWTLTFENYQASAY